MSTELLNTVKTFYERFGAGDLDGATDMFDPGVESVTPTGPIHGRDAFRAYGEVFRTAFPDSRMTIVSAMESGSTVAAEGRYTGAQTGPLVTPQGEIPPSGRSIDLPYADFFRFEGGRIVSHHVYYDQVTFLTQLGLMSEPSNAES
jgi:steroid delta-isomerase-like uncharacterized protein